MYTISNSNGLQGRAWTTEYDTETDALEALCAAMGWDADEAVCSESYTVGEGTAVSVYKTQAEHDADETGAYAPRITELEDGGS